jgi:hypothetical protein
MPFLVCYRELVFEETTICGTSRDVLDVVTVGLLGGEEVEVHKNTRCLLEDFSQPCRSAAKTRLNSTVLLIHLHFKSKGIGAINYCIRKELKVFLFLNHRLVSLLYYYHIEHNIKIRSKSPPKRQ